jgi:hypothetical protein
MDHKEDEGYCGWCFEQWPCLVAEVRKELAAHIRKESFQEGGAGAGWDWSDATAVADNIADLIDVS